ncbi:MAG: nucleotidyltransferase family protein [Defluviitaleaceae bacterium]|nr:nucleotidyltransferase family protein [Defluviitaleaceae bacterium]
MNKLILQTHEMFISAGFDYAICGGFALDMYAGKEIREHGDFDILVYKEDKQRAVQFMMDKGWDVLGRFGENGAVWQFLFYKVADINDCFWDACCGVWAIAPGCLPNVLEKIDRLKGGRHEVYTYKSRKWHVQDDIEFIEIAFDTKDGKNYIALEKPKVARSLDKAILHCNDIPYLAPEVVLCYKSGKGSMESAYAKPRTEMDFKAIMPILSEESRKWLLDTIDEIYPDGYPWLDGLI